MELLTQAAAVACMGAGNWVAVGNWDGVHVGHQSIIKALVAEAHAAGGRAVVVGFHPHPMAIIRPSDAPRMLQTLPERAATLAALGVDVHLTIPFDAQYAARTAEEFADETLIRDLCARRVMVGFNFTFGRGGKATAHTLEQLCARHGVSVRVFDPVRVAGETVSSTAVRYALAGGEVSRAQEFLGRPFTLAGAVIPGDKRGRQIGYPTANLELAAGRQLPAPGVYAVRAALLPGGTAYLPPGTGPQRLGGMLNLGRRPTFGGEELRCEVHLFDFSADIYGQRIQVEFAERLRGEKAFGGIDALVAQLRQDEVSSRRILGGLQP